MAEGEQGQASFKGRGGMKKGENEESFERPLVLGRDTEACRHIAPFLQP